MGDLVKTILDVVLTAVGEAARTGRSLRFALAEELEQAAAKIRDGRLLVDEALTRAKQDQDLIEKLRARSS